MPKKLSAFLEISDFEKIEDIEGYIFEGEEFKIEVLCIGKRYVVRVERAIRFERNSITYYEFSNYSAVIDCISVILVY